MKELYIPNKVTSLFHAEHSAAQRLLDDARVARIMNIMHAEIERDVKELSHKLTKMLHLCLKANL